MKKILFALSAVALLFVTSCKKDQNAPENITVGEGEFLATIDNGANPQNAQRVDDGMSTMTIIDNYNYVIWEPNDQIKINGLTYTTNMTGGTVKFKPADPSQTATSSPYHAFYPASIAGTGAAGTLPAEQIFYSNGNIKHLPMYAYSTDNQLVFHNICAVLKIQIPGFIEVLGGTGYIEIFSENRMNGAFTVVDNVAVMTSSSPYPTQEDCKISVHKSDYSLFTTSDVIYVAVPAGQYGDFNIKFWSADLMQPIWSNSVHCTLVANRIYPVNISEPITPDNSMFHFTSLDYENEIGLNTSGENAPVLRYCIYNQGQYSGWQLYEGGPISLGYNDEVYFIADHSQGFSHNGAVNTFYSTKDCRVSGNIRCLLNPNGDLIEDYATNPLYSYAFKNLFAGMTHLTDAQLLFFDDVLMPEGCYYGMFQGCTSLVEAPVLPSATLSTNCYYGMFQGCSSLTSAPQLTAATLASNCYSNMFNGCSNLGYVKMIATDVSATDCLNQWLSGAGTNRSSNEVWISNDITTCGSGSGQIIKNATPSNWNVRNEDNTVNEPGAIQQ